ncbi:hypothetical protein GCM10009797_32300 [Nocardioides hwasunensis]
MSDTRRDPGAYILAAAICDTTAQDEIRAEMEVLRLKGQNKLHWHDEDHKRRQVIIERVAQLPLMHLVVVRDQMPDARAERRRRLCMQRLLFELDQLEVATVTFESRGPADDRRDIDMVGAMRAEQTITSQLRIEHQKGPLDPLLWVPDAVCGALTADRVGDSTYFAEITAHTQLITL